MDLSGGGHALSQLMPVFRKEKHFPPDSCLLRLAGQQKCEAGRVVPAWPGQAGVEDLGCLRAIVIQGVQPVPGKPESCSGRKSPSAQRRAYTELSQSTLILHCLACLSMEGEGCRSSKLQK